MAKAPVAPQTYLGDGLYASYDRGQIILQAERDGMTHWVALESEVIEALQRYVDNLKQRREAGDPYDETRST